MGCGTKTVKVASIVFNVILAVLGILTILWIAFNHYALPLELAIGAYIAGALMVLLAMMGCFAAKRESVCLTATCAIFLLFLAILQIVFNCLNLNDQQTRNGFEMVHSAWGNENEMDALQIKHECCGKTSPQDYILLNKPIPASCYSDQEVTSTQGLFTTGCTTKLQEYIGHKSVHFATVSWLIVAFELSGFMLALLLIVNFRNKQRRMNFQ